RWSRRLRPSLPRRPRPRRLARPPVRDREQPPAGDGLAAPRGPCLGLALPVDAPMLGRMRLLRTLVLVGLALGLGACSTAERSTKAPPAAVAPDDVAAEAAHAVPEPRARPLVKHVIIFVADTLRRDRVPPTD